MSKSANLLHKCGLGDSDMNSTVFYVHFGFSLILALLVGVAKYGNIVEGSV